jgi:hypothetical protein
VSWLGALPKDSPLKVKKVRKKYTMPLSHPGRGGKKVEINGKPYPTIRAAAKALGVSVATISRRMGWKKDPRKRHDQ